MSEHTTTLATQTAPLEHDTHREHLAITRDWLQMFGAVGLASVLIVTALGIAATVGAALWLTLPLLTLFIFALIAAMIVLRSLEFSRYSLHQRFESWLESQETAREIARIQATQSVNVSVKGRQNVVSVNSGQKVEDIRLIPVHGASATTRMLDGVPEQDLIFFAERAPIMGHSQRAWMGVELPSGNRIAKFDDYDKLLQPFMKAGLIVGRAERSAGKLVSGNPEDLKRALGLSTGAQDAPTKDVTPEA